MAEIPDGFCQCGCGQETSRWRYGCWRWGAVKGEYRKWANAAHGHRKPPAPSDFGRFKIEGVYCRLITLDKGLYAVVHEDDYQHLMQFRWVSRWNPTARTHYAIRYFITPEGKRSCVFMHREIMGAKWKDGSDSIDHIETGNGIDNRRYNLRRATRSQQMWNTRISARSTTGIKGVFPEGDHYCAVVRIKGKRVWRRRSFSLETLAAARAEQIKKYHGEFARTA